MVHVKEIKNQLQVFNLKDDTPLRLYALTEAEVAEGNVSEELTIAAAKGYILLVKDEVKPDVVAVEAVAKAKKTIKEREV